jgi:hypothetical protein
MVSIPILSLGRKNPGRFKQGIRGEKTKTGQELHASGYVLLSRPEI